MTLGWNWTDNFSTNGCWYHQICRNLLPDNMFNIGCWITMAAISHYLKVNEFKEFFSSMLASTYTIFAWALYGSRNGLSKAFDRQSGNCCWNCFCSSWRWGFFTAKNANVNNQITIRTQEGHLFPTLSGEDRCVQILELPFAMKYATYLLLR